MSRSLREYFHHILDEVQYLQDTTSHMSKEQFLTDETVKRACVRSIEIIGEASKHVPLDIRDKYPQVDWRAISGMRDRLVHHYFGIDYDIVWDVIATHIEVLGKTIEKMLAEDTA